MKFETIEILFYKYQLFLEHTGLYTKTITYNLNVRLHFSQLIFFRLLKAENQLKLISYEL